MKNIRKIIPDTLLFLVVAYVGSIDFKASCLLVAGLSVSALFSKSSHTNQSIKKDQQDGSPSQSQNIQ